MKRQLTKWEKMFAKDTIDKRLISKVYKQLIQLIFKKKKLKKKKWVKIYIGISPKKTAGTGKDTQCH